MPRGEPRRPRKRGGSIRDAAASAAGSASSSPPPGRQAAPREPDAPFPDFDTPSAGWDPWDQTIEGPPGDGFDPNRTLGDWLEAVIPPEAQVHFIRAGQEFAAGVQTTVDHHLGRREGDAGPDGATRIEIE